MFKPKYGDVKFGTDTLSDSLFFTSIDHGIASESTVTTQENAGDGSDILYVRRKAKEISVKFVVKSEVDRIAARRDIACILSATETKVLVFGDEANLYYNAIPSGKLELDDDGFTSSGSFSFLVPDGISHRTDRAILSFSNSGGVYGSLSKNSDGSISGTLKNCGSKPAFLRAIVTNSKETGFIGLVLMKQVCFRWENQKKQMGQLTSSQRH